MGTPRDLTRRLADFEDLAVVIEIQREAERVSALTGAPVDWLITRARELAAISESRGREDTIGLAAAEQLRPPADDDGP